jgi:ribonuclease BN (tRNA processing enzyme)
MKVEVLCRGFPGKADVGFLGLSNVALITAESERILFDTGAMGVRLNLLHALEKYSVRPCDVNKVVLSHLHYDHCDNAFLFPNATFFVSEDEWAYATNGDDLHTYIYQQKDANGTVTSGTKEVYTFNISETFPAGVKFENGKTVSFYYDFCNVKVYSWDVVNNNWKTTPNSDNSYNEYGLFLTIVKSSDGKAIYFINEQFYRSMINESLLSR